MRFTASARVSGRHAVKTGSRGRAAREARRDRTQICVSGALLFPQRFAYR